MQSSTARAPPNVPARRSVTRHGNDAMESASVTTHRTSLTVQVRYVFPSIISSSLLIQSVFLHVNVKACNNDKKNICIYKAVFIQVIKKCSSTCYKGKYCSGIINIIML